MNAPLPQIRAEDRLTAVSSEHAVLGAMLIVNDCFDRLGDLRAEHFTVGDHRAIFAEIVKQVGNGKPADAVTVFERLQASGQTAADLGYILALAQNAAGSASAARHAAI